MENIHYKKTVHEFQNVLHQNKHILIPFSHEISEIPLYIKIFSLISKFLLVLLLVSQMNKALEK